MCAGCVQPIENGMMFLSSSFRNTSDQTSCCMGKGQGAGLHFLVEFAEEVEAEGLIQMAEEAGVRVYPVTPFWSASEACPPNLLFAGYSLLNERQIQEGLRLLKEVWAPVLEIK